MKIARHYTRRAGIIAFEDAFHGRTQLAMSLTGKTKPYKAGFGPFSPEINQMPYAYCLRCPYNRTPRNAAWSARIISTRSSSETSNPIRGGRYL